MKADIENSIKVEVKAGTLKFHYVEVVKLIFKYVVVKAGTF